MIIVSCRKDFTNPEEFSREGNEFKEINLDSPDALGTDLDVGSFLNKLPSDGKEVLILVHGYNNEHDDICDAYSIIEGKVAEVGIDYGLVIGYSWPGMDDKLEFWSAIGRANKAARRFRKLLNLIVDNKEDLKLDIMSHSLGARVVLRALKRAGEGVGANDYYCMAPAVDDEVLEKNEEFFDATKKLKRIHVFHSERDRTLRVGYRLAQFDRALGTYGPENLNDTNDNVYTVNCDHCVRAHGGYKHKTPIYNYIKTPVPSGNRTTTLSC